jgi:hypothetical protein
MNAREIKIAIGLVVLALVLWFGWKAIQPDRPADEANAVLPASVPAADVESSLLKEFSVHQLIQASNLLRAAFDQTLDLEGEPATIAGCSFSHEETEQYLNGLRVLLDEAKVTERRKYLANSADYERANEFAKCEESCTCAGFADLLTLDAPVAGASAEPAGEAVGDTTAIVTELHARASKQTPDMVFACASQQDWFCKSRLHHYLESESAGN